MEKSFWLEVWESSDQGFHQGTVNRALELWLKVLSLEAGDVVFVPLCGKAYDMLWLTQQGYRVIGVELSAHAIEDFFTAHDIDFTKHQDGQLCRYEGGNIVIYQGDFFDINVEHVKLVSAVYDRAALVALPEDMRTKYAAHMKNLFAAGVQLLQISLEFDGEGGPPHSLTDAEIERLYGDAAYFNKLGEKDLIELEQRMQEKGYSYFLEKTHHIKF